MFARLKETVRVITYRAPVEHGPDAVIVEKSAKPRVPTFGKIVAYSIEGFVCMSIVGYIAGHIGDGLFRVHPIKSVSLTTIAGALGALLAWLGHGLLADVQKMLQKRLNLTDKLAPHFGHKVDETYRILRG